MFRHRPAGFPPFSFLLFLFLTAFAPPAGAAAAAKRAALVPETRDGQIPVNIETSSPETVAALLERLGGRVDHVFGSIDAVSGTVPADAWEALAAEPTVGTIERQRLVYRTVVPFDRKRFEAAGMSVPRTVRGDFVSEPVARFRVRAIPREELAQPARGAEPISFIGYEKITRAHEIRNLAGYGERTTTAIIDTGVYSEHPMYAGNVAGGWNLVPREEEEAIDHDGDGQPDGRSFSWGSVHNNSHGTFVAGLIAGHVDLELEESDGFVQAVNNYQPESVVFDGQGGATVRLFGLAPATDLFAVKVFPYDGGAAPDARVAAAIDRLIAMRENGTRRIDVINMSLSGPVLHDGFNPLDLMVTAATRKGITCVSAAANAGPSLVSVGSPASSRDGLAVGAAVDPIHTRAAVEDVFGAPPGSGTGFYPEDIVQIADFSSRGLTADGRVKPDLVATGFLVYSSTLVDVTGDDVPDEAGFGWSFGGTSFAAPIVAGAAAVVTSYARDRGPFGRAPFVARALERAAEPIAELSRISQREQGGGYVSLPEAIRLIGRHRVGPAHENPRHERARQHDLARGALSAGFPELTAGETFTFFLRVPPGTRKIDFRVPDVSLGAVQNPFFGDQLGVVIHSAKRGGSGDYVFGEGTLEPGTAFTYEYPEPGTARVTFFAGPGNYSPASASLVAEATAGSFPAEVAFRGVIRREGLARHRLEVPGGKASMGIRLSWRRDWSRFPTTDLDMFIETPDGDRIPLATIDSPEMLWIEDPPAGSWEFRIHELGTVRGTEHYELGIAYEEVEREEAAVDLARPRLVGARPSPFAGATELSFAIPARGPVSLEVFDVAGRLVRTLVDEPLDAGAHAVRWDGRDGSGGQTAAGVYFLRLSTERGSASRKVVRVE